MCYVYLGQKKEGWFPLTWSFKLDPAGRIFILFYIFEKGIHRTSEYRKVSRHDSRWIKTSFQKFNKISKRMKGVDYPLNPDRPDIYNILVAHL